MAITKTKFINYIRCPRYVALDDLKKEKLDSLVTLKDYRAEEIEEYMQEILDDMFDEDGNDLIDEVDEQLQVMLPYYNQVETLAGGLAPNYFSGTFKYAADTKSQESFDAKINGIRYLCYVDIYNEHKDGFNIIEVKATTTTKFLDMTFKEGDDKISIFRLGTDHIYHLLEDDNDFNDYDHDKYLKQKAKLYNRFDNAGHYVYDIAVQRYIIENDLKQNGMEHKIEGTKYYLAVLNHQYVYDGTQIEGLNIYNKDAKGHDIICYFDMTSVTRDLMDTVDLDRAKVEKYVSELKIDKVPIGDYCENKKTTKCKYIKECWKMLPKTNSLLTYIGNHHGFQDELGNKYDRYDLINDGKVSMLDLDERLLNRYNNVIQRRVVASGVPFMDNDKIKVGLAQIVYPIYHLDFETFPCPIPRLRGEKCYTQSVFQFSLHIETSPGRCDKEKDHYEYLAIDHKDHREELIKKMIEWIDTTKPGTILVYNESFEKTRLKELGEIFPAYKKELNIMREMIFDLMNIVKTKSSMYEELGFEEERAKMFNYYHSDMNGSFSIKKILPLFSDLSYKGMEIGNGVNAIVAFASFPKLSKEEFNYKYQKLVEYCKQDTWAMVEILHGLTNIVK